MLHVPIPTRIDPEYPLKYSITGFVVPLYPVVPFVPVDWINFAKKTEHPALLKIGTVLLHISTRPHLSTVFADAPTVLLLSHAIDSVLPTVFPAVLSVVLQSRLHWQSIPSAIFFLKDSIKTYSFPTKKFHTE